MPLHFRPNTYNDTRQPMALPSTDRSTQAPHEALALSFSGEEFLWGLAAVAQLLRIPFDPALALAASPPPLTVASLARAIESLGARAELAPIDAGGG